MRKLLLSFLTSLFSYCSGQNLIQNPSFEIFDTCPYNTSQIQFANNWQYSAEWGCSSEYYNICMKEYIATIPFMLKIISEITPHTDKAFAGILGYWYGEFVSSPNSREAISTKLNETLVPNENYCVTFYIRFPGYWLNQAGFFVNYAIKKMGAFLSQDSILYLSPGFPEITYYSPQITYSGDFLNDSLNWVRVSGTFIAQGNEKWIHIANFFSDDSTQLYLHPYLSTFEDSMLYQSYYLIDDVSVYPCDAPVYFADAGRYTCIKPGRSITLGLPNRDEYLYWWLNGNTGDTISRQSQIVVSPQVTTKYILVQKDFKFDETRDTVLVEVDNHCYEMQVPEINIPNIITPNGDGYNDKFEIENSKYYKVSVSLYNRWGNLIYESINYQNEWPEKDFADGVYYYTVKYSCTNQEIKTQSGSVSVIR